MWTDENGKQQSEAEVEEIKQSSRITAPLNKNFNEICDYWLEKRLPQKGAEKMTKTSFSLI